MATTLLCGSLIDGKGGDPIPNAAIRIESGTIAWAGPAANLAAARGDAVIDASHLTILPGLVNAHEHMGIDVNPGQALQDYMGEPLEYLAMRAVKNARIALRSGNTTIRDMAAKGRISAMIRRLIEERLVPGPRMFIAGRNIVRTGGYGWFIGRTADGAEAFRQAIRDEIRENNVDHIKLMVTGGLAVKGSRVLQPEMRLEEVTAAVDEAHRLGRKVAAHAYGGEGVKDAIEAGVDSIEHGAYLSEEDVRMMVQRGTYLVSTVGIFDSIADSPLDQTLGERARTAITNVREILGGAAKSGLRVAVGTDPLHGRLHREVAFLVESGYSTIAALRVASHGGAVLCGIGDRVGTLEAGRLADVIGVRGDVASDIARLADVSLVMKEGVVEFGPKGVWGP
jgi:imidazolonepropionase-like amidohydrolase